jgi:hypothetical protein
MPFFAIIRLDVKVEGVISQWGNSIVVYAVSTLYRT